MKGIFSTIEGLSMILLGYFPYMWDLARYLAAMLFQYFFKTELSNILMHEIVITWLFLTLTIVVDTFIKLPFSIYRCEE
jgi:hypothetical protein